MMQKPCSRTFKSVWYRSSGSARSCSINVAALFSARASLALTRRQALNDMAKVSPRSFGAKVVKLNGEFIWHHHEREDELFLVVEGRLRMQFRTGHQDIGPGEFIIVPRGVEHCPLGLTEEVHVVLLEPKTTLNTGNVRNERTVAQLKKI